MICLNRLFASTYIFFGLIYFEFESFSDRSTAYNRVESKSHEYQLVTNLLTQAHTTTTN